MLFGIEWAIDKQTIINFKKRILTFEDIELRVVAQVDPLEGHSYVQKVNKKGQDRYLDHIYNISSMMQDNVNLEIDGKLILWIISSFSSDSGESLKNWQDQLNEVSMWKCARIIKSLRWVGAEVLDLPTYEGFPKL